MNPCSRPLRHALALGLSLVLPAVSLPSADFTVNAGDNLPAVTSLDTDANTITLMGDINRESGNGTYALADKQATIRSGLADNATVNINGNGSFRLLSLTGGRAWTFDNIIFNNGRTTGNNDGGTIQISGGADATTTLNGNFQIQNSMSGRAGGAIHTAGNTVFGGDVTFSGNTAGGSGNGGALYTTGSTYFGGDAKFSNNTAGGQGGALYTTGDITFGGDALFSSNTSTGHAGALITTGADITFVGKAVFEFNTSAARGGALATSGDFLIFKDIAVFTSNTGMVNAYGGGAIFGHGGTTAITFEKSSTFTNNTVNGDTGGAIHALGNVEFKGHASFYGNKTTNDTGATNGGGAIRIATALTSLTFEMGVTATGNTTASRNGGALYINGNYLYVGGNSEFIGNQAGNNGGAIYLNAAATTVTLDASDGDITFKDNKHKTSTTEAANAITFGMGNNVTHTLNLNTGTGTAADAAGHTIYFHDPIAGSANSGTVTVTQTGSGAVVYDTHASTLRMLTTVASGTLMLTRGAAYGSAANFGSFTLAPGAVLAGNGAILAQTITLQPGSTLEVLGGGTLVLNHSAALAGATGLVLAGSGTIEAGGALSAAAIRVGTPTPDDPAGAPLAHSPGTLALSAATPLTIEQDGLINIDLFSGNAADLLQAASLTVTGSAFINLLGTGSGSYKILAAAADISALNLVTLVNGAAPTARYTPTRRYENGGTEIWYDFATKNMALTWTGSAGTTWKNSAITDANWTDGASTDAETYFQTGDRVTFNAAGAGTITIDAAGVTVADMEVNTAADYTFAGAGGITSSTTASTGLATAATGKLVKTGAGVLAFTNAGTNTFIGGIDLDAGAIAFTDGDQIRTAGASITFAAAATGTLLPGVGAAFASTLAIGAGATAVIEVQNAATATYRGTLLAASTADTLAKTGAGALILDADNAAFAGATEAGAGALYLAPGAKLGGDINVAAGATFGGSGTASGTVSMAANATLEIGAPGAATAQTLTLNDLTLAGSTLLFDLFSADAGDGYQSSDRLSLTGALAPGAAQNTILIGAFQTGTFNLGNIGALAGSATAAIAGGGGTRQRVSLDADAGKLILVAGADMSRSLTWTGSSGNAWNTTQTNWTDGGPVNEFVGGDRAIFDGAADNTHPANRAIRLDDGTVRVADMWVLGDADYTFAGAHGIHASPAHVIHDTDSPALVANPTGKLVKTGPGALVFSNSAANLFTGGIEIGGGTIAFSRDDHLGDGGNGILFTGDGALRADADSLSLANNITVAADSTATLDTRDNAVVLTGTLASLSGGATFAKSGSGALTLTADSSAFTGKVSVASGTLLLAGARLGGAVDAASGAVFGGTGAVAGALEAAAGAAIIVDGALSAAALRFSGSGALAGSGTLAVAGATLGSAADDVVTADVAGNNTLAIAGAVFAGAGTLEKTGSGALVLDATTGGGALAGIRVSAGTLSTAWLAGAVENNAALVLNQTADLAYSGTMTGAGAFAKNGAHELAVTGAINTTGPFTVNAGRLKLAAAGAPFATGAFTLAPGAELHVSGTTVMTVASFAHAGAIKIGAAAGDATFGKLTINSSGAYAGGGEIHLGIGQFTASGLDGYDRLVLNTPGVTGTLTVRFSQISADPIPAGQSLPGDIITGSNLDGVEQSGWVEYGSYKYTWTPDGAGTGGVWSGALIDTVNAAIGVDAASVLVGKASIDSLSQRLLASRFTRRSHDFEVWINGLYRNDSINKKLYGGSDVRTSGVQAGADISRSAENSSVAFGVFYDHARADMTQADGMSGVTTDADAYGVYGAVRLGRWYVDVITRNARESHGIDVRHRPRMETTGDSWAASIEAGVVLDDMSGVFFWEPQAQLIFQRHKIDSCADFAGRVYDIAAADSLEGRLGVRAWMECEWRRGLKLVPWLRASGVHEFKGGTRVTVAGDAFTNDLGGTRGAAAAGVTMQLGRGFALNAEASWYYGEVLSGHSFNLGLGRAW